MKKFYTVLFIGFLFAFNINVNAQCTPDPGCVDLLNPGEICPENLPDGTVGVPYSQVVTVIPPATGTVGGQTINVLKIKLKSVANLPNGLSYQCSPANCEFAVTSPFTRYCILISGTPTTAGSYPLSITVTPYISVFGVPTPVTDQVDDTSLAITINPATSSYSIVNMNKFSVLESKPNPFSYSSKIGFISPTNNIEVKLTVFDVVGNMIYNEKTTASKGENYFEFDGVKLGKGMYFYTVSNGKESTTKQLIKN